MTTPMVHWTRTRSGVAQVVDEKLRPRPKNDHLAPWGKSWPDSRPTYSSTMSSAPIIVLKIDLSIRSVFNPATYDVGQYRVPRKPTELII